MKNHDGVTRRDVLRGTLAAAGLGTLGIPEWALPALARGDAGAIHRRAANLPGTGSG